MSEWPKRYGVIISGWEGQKVFHYVEQNHGEWIKFEDFERLLNFTAEFIKYDKRFEEIKRSLLTQVPPQRRKKWIVT
jgi:hypothetical protein